MYNIAIETLLQQHFKNSKQTKPEINNYKNKIKKIGKYKKCICSLYVVYALFKSAYKLHVVFLKVHVVYMHF